MITKFKIFERKGDYNLFHITDDLESIINDGYIKGSLEWDSEIRKNIIPNWKKDRFKTISATRNFNYIPNSDVLELDVQKISDNYKIIPFSENPDFFLAFIDAEEEGKVKSLDNLHMNKLQNMIRSKSPDSGNLFWRYKTDTKAMDFGIAEELIIANKLDVSKYVKHIFINIFIHKYTIESIIRKIKDKYPHIEVTILSNDEPYIKRKLKKEPQKQVSI